MVLLNILEKLISLYSNEETRFIRQPINLLCAYLESNYFREHREQKTIKDLQSGGIKLKTIHRNTMRNQELNGITTDYEEE